VRRRRAICRELRCFTFYICVKRRVDACTAVARRRSAGRALIALPALPRVSLPACLIGIVSAAARVIVQTHNGANEGRER